MAKVQIKSVKITPFGGKFHVREHFSRLWVLCQVSNSVAATVWRNNGFGWARLPKSFMAENTVFLLLTALIRNFYKFLMDWIDAKAFGLKKTSCIKAFVFKFISVPAAKKQNSRVNGSIKPL